ncbi:hypothetical protein [Tropicimonas aquimaris]|uniref:Uncharacterized protein n=1 Tax=Tropicimonas aquimaris TaxID=914152 RepID=A0ABW3ISG1_9RHOB
MTDNKWTRANRLTRISHHRIHEYVVDETLHPARGFFDELLPGSEHLAHLKAGDSYWSLRTTKTTGLDSNAVSFAYFASRQEAEEAARITPIGTEVAETAGSYPRFKEIGADEVERLISVDMPDGIFMGIYEAFEGAGVAGADCQISRKVHDRLGAEHIDWMKETYGNNWNLAAILEYCLNHFPASLLATLGARAIFLMVCSDRSFSEGYLFRQFEAIFHGSEGLAQAADSTRKKAGEGGGRHSNAKRQERLEALMTEIEKLSGIVGQMSEERILAQAWDNLKRARPDTPATPSIRFKYEVDLRSLDAFAARYRAVFAEGA